MICFRNSKTVMQTNKNQRFHSWVLFLLITRDLLYREEGSGCLFFGKLLHPQHYLKICVLVLNFYIVFSYTKKAFHENIVFQRRIKQPMPSRSIHIFGTNAAFLPTTHILYGPSSASSRLSVCMGRWQVLRRGCVFGLQLFTKSFLHSSGEKGFLAVMKEVRVGFNCWVCRLQQVGSLKPFFQKLLCPGDFSRSWFQDIKGDMQLFQIHSI